MNRASHDRVFFLVVEDGRAGSQAADILARGRVADDADRANENAVALIFDLDRHSGYQPSSSRAAAAIFFALGM
jgi:hypothetical protein